jgi:hypothetical protein
VSFETIISVQIYAALNGVISTSIYEQVPQGTEFPYVAIGQINHVEDDTDSTTARECTYTLHTWSDSHSLKEAQLIQGEMFDALHLLKFVEVGYTFTENYYLSSEIFTDSDGQTKHGVSTFKLTIQKV